ncbi:MAG: hypothetical protein DI622_02220 [Chryseobacterium sp.]|nr:hypothetical protein [Chryseobacterium sp.]PZU25863.1 MAG: hypothetical protein DI622_02220 [Chryseobacterium sp.]
MKKIFYIPGLISALLIPILFWYYGNQKFEEINLSVIDLGLPAKLKSDKSNLNYTFESARNWDYKKIIINPNQAKENSKLYVSEVKLLQKRNEKNTGIEFILDKNNTYGDLVSLLNDMELSSQYSYCLDLEKTGHFFVPIVYNDPNIRELKYNYFTCGGVIREEYRPTYFEKIQQTLTNLPKQTYYIIFGFLLFINISMLSIKERFQLQ